MIMFLITLTIGIYSTWGGFSAVVKTDKFQFVFVAAYLSVVAVLAADRIGTIDWSLLKPAKAQSMLWDTRLFALIIITALAYFPGWLSEADLWLRIQAARDEKEARKAACIGLCNSFLFVGIVPAMIALSALILFPPQDADSALWIGKGAEKIISAIISPYQNSILVGFLSLGLLTASMSTIDTCTNIVSLNVSRDLLKIKDLLRSKISNAAVLAVTFFVALNVDSLWDIFYLSSGLLSTTVAIPVLATLGRAIPVRAVYWSSLSGFLSTVFFYFNNSHNWINLTLSRATHQTGLEYIIFGLLSAAAGFGLGYLSDPNKTN
jgi:Na+/proline symporter